jgi:hypothetical protein
MLRQENQELQRHAFQTYRLSIPVQLMPDALQFEFGEANFLVGHGRPFAAAFCIAALPAVKQRVECFRSIHTISDCLHGRFLSSAGSYPQVPPKNTGGGGFMKHAKLIALLVLTLSIAGTAQLGSTDKIVAKVPFDFTTGNKVVPAGNCIVERVSLNALMLAIRNPDAKTVLITAAVVDQVNKPTGKYVLVSYKHGNRHFLRQVKTADGMIYKIPEGKLEQEIMARNSAAEEEFVLASRE